jgi:integral membrane sensor domain MASE1
MRYSPKHEKVSWIRDRWHLILVVLVLVAGIVAALLLTQGSGTGY